MLYRLILPAVLGVAMLSTPVLAAGSPDTGLGGSGPSAHNAYAMPSSDRCTRLKHQFDEAIKTRQQNEDASDAIALRNEGGKLCNGIDPARGVDKLLSALWTLDVQPNA